MRMIACLATLALVFMLACPAPADDWPQWMGPQRDGVWRESGVIQKIPTGGLKIVWRTPVAWGYAGPAVAQGRVFVPDFVGGPAKLKNNPGAREKFSGQERLLCLDAASGKLLWKHEEQRDYNLSFPGGPRATPTVSGDKVYTLGAEGNLTCLAVESGQVVWRKDFAKDYGAATQLWGVAAHPLVDAERVYCLVGGKDTAVVAFDKHSGREAWRSLSAREPGYSPAMFLEQGGVKQVLVWTPDVVAGLAPQTGAVLWSVPVKPRFGMAIAAPRADAGKLLASGFGEAVLLKLDPAKPGAELLWRAGPKEAFFCGTSTPILKKGVAYGCDIETGALMAVRLADRKRLWETLEPTLGGTRNQRYGTAFLVPSGDRFFLFNEKGDLILARLSPEKYEELGRFHVLEPTNHTFGRPVVWSHPAFANRSLYARNDKEVVCVSLVEE